MNPFHSMPKWGEDDLACRMLVDPPYKEKKYVLNWGMSKYDRFDVMEKIRNLTTGNFFMSGFWIQFEDEADFINMSLAI